jgi:hypothetical protein
MYNQDDPHFIYKTFYVNTPLTVENNFLLLYVLYIFSCRSELTKKSRWEITGSCEPLVYVSTPFTVENKLLILYVLCMFSCRSELTKKSRREITVSWEPLVYVNTPLTVENKFLLLYVLHIFSFRSESTKNQVSNYRLLGASSICKHTIYSREQISHPLCATYVLL